MRNRPSQTALKIARITAWLGHQAELAELLPPDCAHSTAALLRAGGFLEGWHEAVYRGRSFAVLAGLSERWFAPGQLVGLALRKRFVDDEVRAAIADGATQVLVVGAGLDTLALRLAAEFPDVTFFELDHPATQSAKQAAIDALTAVAAAANLRLCPVDLSRATLKTVLQDLDGWSRTAVSIAVAEGVLMYLTERNVSALFEGVRAGSKPGSRVVFSYLPANERGDPDLAARAGVLSAALAMIGEPWTWALRDLDGFLRARGFRPMLPPGRRDLAARYLAPLGRGIRPIGLERFAVAESV